MDLLEVRKQFIEQSGRHDLVEDLTDYVDNGADYLINAAVRELDTEVAQTMGARGIHYGVLEASSKFASLPRCRTIETVWVTNSDGRQQLAYLSYPEFRNLSVSDEGVPRFYAPVMGRHIPDLSTLDQEDQDYIKDTVDVYESDYRGIAIAPANETQMVIEVHGTFYSAVLESDDDENYWTATYPDILIKAAMRELERSYRNRQGAEDLSMAISEQLNKIDMDLAMDQASKTDQMRG